MRMKQIMDKKHLIHIDLSIFFSDVCKAENCRKPKLKHSGHSGEQHHDYCSVACLRADYLSRSKRKGRVIAYFEQSEVLKALS